MARREPVAKRDAQLFHGPCDERAIRELLLLGPVEEVEERADLPLRPGGPGAGPPAAAQLELDEIGPLAVREGRHVQGEQARELRVQLFDSVGQGVLRRYRRR